MIQFIHRQTPHLPERLNHAGNLNIITVARGKIVSDQLKIRSVLPSAFFTGCQNQSSEFRTDRHHAGGTLHLIQQPVYFRKNELTPQLIFRNMEELKLSDVRKVIKVGDTVSDIKEGKQAGMESVGVLEGSSVLGLSQKEYEALSDAEKEEKLKEAEKTFMEAGADYVIRDIRGLLDILCKNA